MTYDHWKATEPDAADELPPEPSADELDRLAELYDRAHADCKYRDVICHECGHYPPPEVLYRA